MGSREEQKVMTNLFILFYFFFFKKNKKKKLKKARQKLIICVFFLNHVVNMISFYTGSMMHLSCTISRTYIHSSISSYVLT